MVVRTVHKKPLINLCILCDILSILTSLVGFPAAGESFAYCDFGFDSFILMLTVYQFFAALRLAILLCHFVYGKRFWRRVKRCCACLNTVEYEMRVEFDIYDAQSYVEKVNASIKYQRETASDESFSSMRRSTLKVELKYEDLTCAICLENFIKREESADRSEATDAGDRD